MGGGARCRHIREAQDRTWTGIASEETGTKGLFSGYQSISKKVAMEGTVEN